MTLAAEAPPSPHRFNVDTMADWKFQEWAFISHGCSALTPPHLNIECRGGGVASELQTPTDGRFFRTHRYLSSGMLCPTRRRAWRRLTQGLRSTSQSNAPCNRLTSQPHGLPGAHARMTYILRAFAFALSRLQRDRQLAKLDATTGNRSLQRPWRRFAFVRATRPPSP